MPDRPPVSQGLTETSIQAGTVEDLYGPLNDVERKSAPPRFWLQGDAELLRQGQRVAVVGSRSPSPAGQRAPSSSRASSSARGSPSSAAWRSG